MSSNKPPEQSAFDFGPARREPEALRTPQRADARPVRFADAPPPIPVEKSPSSGEKQEPRVFSVSDLVRGVARTVEGRFGMIAVEGEISNFSAPRSGHLYFTLKDAEAQLPAVMFRSAAERLKFAPHDGLVVRARGRCSIFEAQGKFQLYVEGLEPAGLGALQLAFEQLKQKLAAEGLFDPARKRPLPKWPRRIGVVTSPTGAAVRDLLRIGERRGRARFLISPCQVQGDAAAADVVRAIKRVERYVDVIVIARGGGSAEDLAAFNDEALARAIAACAVPVVSAIGHEVDFTIADFVADARAPTPSGAADLVVPHLGELQQRLDECAKRLMRDGKRLVAESRLKLDGELNRAHQALRQQLARRRRVLDDGARRMAALHPRARLHRDHAALVELQRRVRQQLPALFAQKRTLLAQLRTRLEQRLQQALDGRKRHFALAAGKLHALSPLAVLQRGYAIARLPDGTVVTDAAQTRPGDTLEVKLLHGRLDCRVQSSEREGADE
jgi:exodeoxyribonuclease VII large subunit